MDLLPEAPSSDPEIKPGLLKTREWDDYTAVISPSYTTSMPVTGVNCERGPAADRVATSSQQQAIQWFGVDVGGTLVKAVYYETQQEETREDAQGTTGHRTEGEGVAAMKKFIKSNLKYGSTGIRDQQLEMHGQRIGGYVGTLHFIKFATSRMDGFFDMATNNGLAKFPKRLGVNLAKYDEMECLISGLHYLCHNYSDECYYWENPNSELSRRVPFQLGPDPYPYIIVNIGSGVSILRVDSAKQFKRIGGTSVGGGTFTGLCSLLAGADSFEAAITLAEKGDSHRVDKLVRDIYGGDYARFGLGGDVVASSFGHMANSEKRKDARPEDLAKATLVTVTNNIGAIARMCASISGVERVVFVGNYLCGNVMSMQMLAYAMEYWSQGQVKALFLRHEGYFGALGCLLNRLNSEED
jgi:type II pantothenate kinase